MAQNRRLFLKLAGASALTITAAGAGLGVFAATRTPVRALVPWETAMSGAHGDARLRALAWAILVPNPHNIQPWLFELVGADEVRIWCDPERRLPATDPFDRQITIGFGCMLEQLRMAAADAGLAAQITPFPDGAGAPRLDDRPIAHVRLTPADAAPDPLFAHAAIRRSDKAPFDDRSIAPDLVAALLEAAAPRHETALIADTDSVAALRDLTWRAMELELRAPAPHRESVDLMRIGRAEIEANPDGISLQGAMIEALNMAGVITRETLADPASTAFSQTLDMMRAQIYSARGYAVLTTPGDTRAEQLEAGRDWLRLNLAACGLGLGFQPLSQALQEYEAMAGLYAEAHDRLAPGGGRVQMIARLGHGAQPARTPRWPLESRMMA